MSEIGQMTLHDVRRLSSYAKINPSLRQLVAACAVSLGVKLPDPTDKPKPMGVEQAKAWASAASRGMTNG